MSARQVTGQMDAATTPQQRHLRRNQAEVPAYSMSPMSLPHLWDEDGPIPVSSYPSKPDSLKLPAVLATELMQTPKQLPTLEPLPSLSLDSSQLNGRADRDPFVKPQPLEPKAPYLVLISKASADSSSPTDGGSVTSFGDKLRRRDTRDTNTTIDDSDDRLAAEALCGLGKVESDRAQEGRLQDEPEPLLSLLSSRHPWLGGTINGSISAYSSIKQFSPRPVQYGATFVENTVGHIGRGVGVEGNIRRYLGDQHPSEVERMDIDDIDHGLPSKRRRTRESIFDHERPTLPPLQSTDSPRSSMDDTRRASIISRAMMEDSGVRPAFRPAAPRNRSWSTQLMISTSGLGVALNEASLRSLRYCLDFLSNTNRHINSLVHALKRLLSQFGRPGRRSNRHVIDNKPAEAGVGAMHVEHIADSSPLQTQARNDSQMTERIKQLNEEIWNTVKAVCTNISKLTGGALPESASQFVKSQLMSVPIRWQRTAPQEAPVDAQSEAISNGQRMVAFASEGLDMMDQVHGVVDDTIKSAEKWLERVGRRSTQEDHRTLENGVGSLRLELGPNGEHILPPIRTMEPPHR